jgi:Cu(I)/Ag(I) efflux system membrane fusion protein
MNTRKFLAVTVVAALAGGAIGWFARPAGEHAQQPVAQKEGRKVLYWYDPMKPDQHFDKPGKSPFMDMDLVPRYADEAAGENSAVRIDPALVQNVGVAYATVARGTLEAGLEVTGSIAFNDRDVAIVQARTGGIVEHVAPRAVGDLVSAGAPLAQLRVPEWLSAQREYLALRGADAALATAARSRLIQLGMSDAEVARIEKSGNADAVVTLAAPRGGMLAEWSLREGMTVAPGQTLARINGLSSVWVEAAVPESQAATLRAGAPVEVRLAATPNELLSGRIDSLVPQLDAETRTVRVRVQLPNRDGRLRPGMYARIALGGANSQPALLVPSDAVIATGKRYVVIVAQPDGGFAPAEVKIGRERGGKSEILDGLTDGQRVVQSGQFLIDSEASLRGVLARMSPQATTHADHAAGALSGRGVVKAIDAHSVTLSHEPIAALKWPAMTMPFELEKPELAKDVKPGDTVHFEFRNGDDGAVVTAIMREEKQP